MPSTRVHPRIGFDGSAPAPAPATGGRTLAWQLPLAVAVAVLAVVANGPTVALLPLFYLAAVTPELVRVDLREHRLPNRLVVPGIAAGLLAAVIHWGETGTLVPLIAGASYAAFLLLLNLTGGMGMGDLKLGAALGLASSTVTVAVLSPVAAFLLGGVASVVLLITRGRGSRIAFGPFLLAGFWIAVALG